MTAGDDPVWLYDSSCILCSAAIRHTLAHEPAGRIRFVAIRSAEGRALAARHGIDPDAPRSFLFVEGGRALVRSDGVIALARHLSGPARLLALGRVLPRLWRDALYDLVARHRHRLSGHRAACHLPDPRHRHRFVLPEGEAR